jgi:hypothetical protein
MSYPDCVPLGPGRDVVIAVSHVGVEIAHLRACMASEEAAATSYTLRSKYPHRVRQEGVGKTSWEE